MNTHMLFLMVGYPGAGKTTTSQIIHKLTGAEHLWADHERKKMFATPAHTHQENLKLYEKLNHMTDDLLAAGKSVIFDTNFNFYKDREKLRAMAAKYGAHTVVVWITTPRDVAHDRATNDAERHKHKEHTRILGDMSTAAFERMAGNLQPPRKDEDVITLDGTHIDMPTVADALERHHKTHEA